MQNHNRFSENQSKVVISKELWSQIHQWYPNSIPIQLFHYVNGLIGRNTPACEFCNPDSIAVEPSKPLSMSSDSLFSPHYVTEQRKKADYLGKHLSEEVINGDGFIPASLSFLETPTLDSIISPSTISTSSPQMLLFSDMLGSSLYHAIENNQVNSSTHYLLNIQSSQRRQLLLQNRALTSLIHRQTPQGYFCVFIRISKAYFLKRSEMKDGCYFIVSSTWLKNWRKWLLRDLIGDVNGVRCDADYQTVREIQFAHTCQHSFMVIPGYMHHFIQGKTALPCTVFFPFHLQLGFDSK